MDTRRLLVALSLAALALGGLAVGPVGAQSHVNESGDVGEWHLNDYGATPGANCVYGPEYAPDYAGLRKVKALAPIVYANDHNPAIRDHQTVKWYWQLQRAHYPELSWKTLDTSNVQAATAYEDARAHFSPMSINHNVGNPDFTDNVYRVKVFIKWVKADGSVEGKANATVDFYKGRAFGYTWVGSNAWCQEVATQG
jgi:hypothetical protein